MNTRHSKKPNQHFDSYLSQFRRRYKLRIIVTAVAAVIFSVLTLSLATAVLKNTLADSNWLYYPARILLVVLPVVILIALLWKPYKQFKQSAGGAELEKAVPEFNGRVDTYLDMKRRDVRSPFVGLLARDAAKTAAKRPVTSLLPTSEVMGPLIASIGMFALAGWLFTSMPLDWRASIKQLWMGWFVSDILPERSIALAPGDTKIRIGDSLFITATLDGFESGLAELHVKSKTSDADGSWETVDMNQQSDGSFSFTLYGVSDPVDYYVSAAFTESPHASVDVVIPAKIISTSHEYFYPDWTGLEPVTVEDATDITVVAGSRVEITFNTDKALQKAVVLHDGTEVDAESIADNSYMASIDVTEEGEYQLMDLHQDDQIPLSRKYNITLIEDAKPTVTFNQPGGDWSATPIEEVVVGVAADDDFSVESVTLNFSVNGAEWQQIPLNEENKFEHLFMLEDFYNEKGGPLLAGDLISYYAEAKDREQVVSTDMLFIDIRPFERRFTQSQQSGGGGGGGSQQQEQEISQRQKEILVSTFNLIRDAKNNETTLIDPSDTATLLSDLQGTLADQAVKLAERAEARQLLNNDPDIARFVEFMEEAAESMRPSAESLALQSFEEAIKHQQRALQYLKRAESIFNDITINRNQSSGGGGGSASRDMAEMYELEMDLAKNQYESPDAVAEGSPQQQASEDAFDKLKDLAKRQQQLAEAAAKKEELSEAERWQQEKLRRELEELQRELEQLQREQSQSSDQQQGQQQSGQQGQEGQEGEQSQQADGSQSSSAGSSGGASQQAMQNLQEAIEELRNSEENASNMTAEERRQAMQSASEKLRQSLEQTADARQQELQQQITDAAASVRDLSQQQQQTSEQLREAMKRAMEARKENRYESGLDSQQEQRLAEQKRQMQRDLESIKQQIDEASKRFSEQAPLTTERLEQALTELDRNQTSELMGISGDMIEEGMAPQAALREERISEALRNLQTDLFESSSLAAAETGTGDESDASAEDATRAIQQLRQALSEALAQSGQNGTEMAELQRLERGSGDEGQQGEGEGESQSGSGQSGQSQEQGQGQGQTGNSSDQGTPQGPGQSGSTLAFGSNNSASGDRELPVSEGQQQLIEESITQLQQLAGDDIEALSDQSRQGLNDLARELQTGNGDENNRRIEANVRLLLKQLEQLELQIYNDRKTAETTRSKQAVRDPTGFDQQAADYFRRLSEPAGS